MVRGIERTTSFRDDTDRAEFLARLPNHAPLWLRTGTRPLAQSLRSLLTGHAGAFNRRHQRKEAVVGDARVLDGSTFVARFWREVEHAPRPPGPPLALATLVARACRQTGITPTERAGGGRRADVTRARNGIA